MWLTSSTVPIKKKAQQENLTPSLSYCTSNSSANPASTTSNHIYTPNTATSGPSHYPSYVITVDYYTVTLLLPTLSTVHFLQSSQYNPLKIKPKAYSNGFLSHLELNLNPYGGMISLQLLPWLHLTTTLTSPQLHFSHSSLLVDLTTLYFKVPSV